ECPRSPLRSPPPPLPPPPPRRNPLRIQIRPQRLRHHHAPIPLLIVFHNRHPGPPDCQPAPIQRVHEVRFPPRIRPVSDLRPARLESLEVAARRDLFILVQARQPHLYVIRLRAG